MSETTNNIDFDFKRLTKFTSSVGELTQYFFTRYTVMGDSGVARGEFIPTVLDWVPGPSNNRPTKAAHLTLKVMSKLDTQSPHGQDTQNKSNVLLKGCKQSAAILVCTSPYMCVWPCRLGCLLHSKVKYLENCIFHVSS